MTMRVPRMSVLPNRAGKDRRSVRRLTWSYAVGLSLIALLTLTAHHRIGRALADQRADGLIINVAGKQRMLSQKVSKAALALSVTAAGDPRRAAYEAELRDAQQQWQAAQVGLSHGDVDRGLPFPQDPRLTTMYRDIQPSFKRMNLAVTGLLAGRDVNASTATILAEQAEYLPRQDTIVSRHQALVDEKVAALERVQWLLMWVTLALLAAEALLVFEPAARQMKRQLRSLENASALMSHQARHDALTGLPNRSALLERLDGLCGGDGTAGEVPQEFALLFIDFDRFKAINDSLGHDVGDQLLVNIARRIERLAAEERGCRVEGFRLGGDEFVILAAGPGIVAKARAFAERALAHFAPAHQLGPHACVSTASIGVVVANPRHASAGGAADVSDAEAAARWSPTTMLRNADLAMFQAKEAGKGRYILFDDSMYQFARRRFLVEKHLRQSIADGTLAIRYQPIFDARSGGVAAVEALLHWEHEALGRVDNAELIDIAEETGLIHDLSGWLFARVAQDAEAYRDDPRLGRLLINLNISRSEAMRPGFADRVKALIAEHPTLADRLCLEFSESVIGRSREVFADILRELSGLRLSCGLDDFGREQSSLSYLAALPLHQVKIDRHLFRTLHDSDDRAWMVPRAITAFAHSVGIKVVAMGIESADHIALALDMDADMLQGRFTGDVTDLPTLAAELDREPRRHHVA